MATPVHATFSTVLRDGPSLSGEVTFTPSGPGPEPVRAPVVNNVMNEILLQPTADWLYRVECRLSSAGSLIPIYSFYLAVAEEAIELADAPRLTRPSDRPR